MLTKAAKRMIRLLLILCLLAAGCGSGYEQSTETTQAVTLEATQPTIPLKTGYVASLVPENSYCDESGRVLGSFTRGTEVKYEITPEGENAIHLGEGLVYL